MMIYKDRRKFLKTACMMAGTLLFSKFNDSNAARYVPRDEEEKKVPVSEDLMREHGVLRRVLLSYNEISGRILKGKNFPPEALKNSAEIIRSFIEGYHEKLEEDYLFPRFEREGKMEDLVKVLKQQHEAGRKLTALIMKSVDSKDKRVLKGYIDEFHRMYTPHAAREDTVLFPEFRKIVSDKEYDSLGEEFERKEKQMFGESGFEKMVQRVEQIEKELGIYELSGFTPRLSGKSANNG
jgi:hemerythrin-like domain-containing protein